MIIIQMMGGLGNQMFQYALYCQLESMGKEVKMDDKAGFIEDEKRFPQLDIFGIDYKRASKKEIIKMRDASMFPLARVRRKLFGRHNNSYFEENRCFQQKIFGWDNIYLEGYWQSEKYFADVGGKLKEEFGVRRLRNNTDEKHMFSEKTEKYLREIKQTESVGVHVRRGDYLLKENQELFGNICTDYYYGQAIKTITARHPGSVFYIFSNDMEWTKDWFQKRFGADVKSVFVEVPQNRDYEAFALLQSCKHNILANSSFSWWASYLNDNPDKMVIVPDRWWNGVECEDIYRADMIKIKVGIEEAG